MRHPAARSILLGVLLLALGLGQPLPLSAQVGYGQKELTFPLEIEGDHSVSVHLFSVLLPGTIRAEVTWEGEPGPGDERGAAAGTSPILDASLTGKRRPYSLLAAGQAPASSGSSPLILTQEVTSEDVERGVGWRLAISSPSEAGRARGSVTIRIPFDEALDRTFQREKIGLSSGEIWPNQSLQATFLSRLRRAPQAGLHAIISFSRTPTAAEAAELEKLGVVRQGFLPRGHSYGLVRKGVDLKNPLVSELVRFITPLDAEDKIDPDILVGNYRRFDLPKKDDVTENYVLNDDGTLELSVLFAPDVSRQQIERILRGVASEFSATSNQLWKITISPARVSALASRDEVQWIEAGPAPYLPTNDDTRTFLKVDEVQAAETDSGGNLVLVGGFPIYHGFSGADITVGVQDNGVDAGHTDLDVVLDNPGGNFHGTHVAGTISGSGLQSDKLNAVGDPNNGDPFEWRGMAPDADVIDSFDLISTSALFNAINTHSLDLSNHSHILGVDGNYSAENRLIDQEIRGGAFFGFFPVPRRLHVWAAANNGGNSPQYGNVVGYFSILNQMKNAVVVGAWTTSTDRLAGFSSMGPSHDGRLKPDVVAPGVNLRSTGGRQHEIQRIEFDGGTPTMGSFTLTLNTETTAAIAFNASAATVENRLVALAGVGVGDLQVGGGPLPGNPVDVTFVGPFSFTNVDQMTSTDSGLDAGIQSKVTTRRNGINLIDGYTNASGTSMASPATAGVIALLLDAWQTTYSVPNGTTVDADPPLPSTLRAVVVQTADDVVMANLRGASVDVDSDSNPANGNDGMGQPTATAGPDFATGWGKLDATAAVSLLTEATTGAAPAPRRIIEDAAGQGDVKEYEFDVTDLDPLKVTLAWDDFEAAIQNPATGIRLVNDLDLELVDPLGTVHYPWQLGQTILDSVGNPLPDSAQPPGTVIQVQVPITPTLTPATDFDYVPASALTGNGAWVAKKGKDHLNNVEQVYVDNLTAPQLGKWKARVLGFDVQTASQDFSLVGMPNPLPAPKIQVPGSVDLGQVCVGDSGTGTLDVCNTGNDYLYVGPITSSNPAFSVTTPSAGYPVAISPDFCFPFQVVFQPLATGPQSATLTVPSNDPDMPSTLVSVFGIGTEPDIRVTGSTDFGVPSAWRPAERTVKVCNTGHCDLQVTAATVGCADFTIVSSPFPATVSSDSCLDVVVRFTPVLPGPKSCNLDIASNDPDTPVVTRTLTARTPPLFSLHTGLVDPHGALGSVTTQGSTFNLDFVYPFKPKWAWDVRASFSRFDGRAGQADVELLNASANARFTVNPAAPVRFFLNGGLGLYHFDPGDFEGGGNLGLGLGVPVGKRFVFEATYNHHLAFTANPNLEYGQIQVGFLVSF